MSDHLQSTINSLMDRASTDDDLRARLVANPEATITAETGLQVPDDWNIEVLHNADGSVILGFVNDELPLDYLELVSGGLPPDSANGGGGGKRSC